MNNEKMEENIQAIRSDIAEIKVDIAKITTKLDVAERALNGNETRPGLVQEVTDHEVRLARLEEKNASRGTMWIVLGFILNAAISMVAIFK